MTTPSKHDMVAAARALRPQIVAARDEIEETQRLPPDLVSAMDDAGLFRIYVPKSLGGPESDPLTALRAVEQLSIADGSVGWCCLIAGSISLYMGWMDAETARGIVGNPPALRGAGSFRPEGTARISDGGFVVNGRWDFASGCLHANWLFFNCVVADKNGPRYNNDGLPELRMMSLPIEAATIHDNWSVIGLRGTGSHDVSVEGLFVPADRTFVLASDSVGDRPTVQRPRRAGHRLHAVGGQCPGHGAGSDGCLPGYGWSIRHHHEPVPAPRPGARSVGSGAGRGHHQRGQGIRAPRRGRYVGGGSVREAGPG